MMKKLFLSAATAAGLLASTSAFAQTVPAIKIQATMNVTDGCNINGTSDFGSSDEITTLNFGTVQNAAGITQNVVGSTAATAGGSPVTLSCNVPLTQVQVTIDGGLNSTAGVRQVAHESVSGETVPYRLYTNAGLSTEIPIDTPVTLFGPVPAGESRTIVIYGQILATDVNSAISGVYDDSAGLLLTF